MGSMQGSRPLAAVTGASSGIGYELARQFALNGFDLLVCGADRGIERLQADFGELGCTVQAHQLDLTTIEGVRAFERALHNEFRPIDVLAINNGVSVCGDFARETSMEEELELIQLDVIASVKLAKAVLPDMIRRRQGKVLFSSSVAAIMATPYEAVHGAAKAFVLSFADSLREELKDTGVTVTTLMPGTTNTALHRQPSDIEHDPSHVAFLGYQALMAGEERVVAASLKTKLQAALQRFVPGEAVLLQH